MNEFVISYIAAMLWSSMDEAENPLDEKHSIEDISIEAMETILIDCKAFINKAGDSIEDSMSRAGHDFWLTRNGHGAGFWDGDWNKSIDDQLTEISKSFGELTPYVGDDGKIYF